jgi:hypothetical protein
VISITVAVSAGDSSQIFFTPADNWRFLMNIIPTDKLGSIFGAFRKVAVYGGLSK